MSTIHNNWQCEICGKYQQRRQRKSKRFCSIECCEKGRIKKCRFCGQEFKCTLFSQRLCLSCHSQESKNVRGQKHYHSTLKEKSCKNCGKNFVGKRQVVLCSECKETLPSPLVHHYDEITRSLICGQCGRVTGTETIKAAWRTDPIAVDTQLCPICKEQRTLQVELNRILRYCSVDSKNKILEIVAQLDEICPNHIADLKAFAKENDKKQCLKKKEAVEIPKADILSPEQESEKEWRKNTAELNKRAIQKLKEENLQSPDNLVELSKIIDVEKEKIHQERLLRRRIKRKLQYQPKTEEEKSQKRQAWAQRMRENNPMKRPEIAAKVHAHLRKKRESGELQTKKGNQNPKWKGNRGFNMDCRNRLYKPWIFKVLERDGFQCVMCDVTRKLHVHHIRPLRDIIQLVLDRNQILCVESIDKTSELYENLIQQVINEHKLSDGITVCCKCHNKIDDKYRRKTHNYEDKEDLQRAA